MDIQKKKSFTTAEKLKLRGEKIAQRLKDLTFRGIGREEAARAALYLFVSFLLARGEWLFGTYPFGIALLCAAEEGLWAIYAGCVLGALFTPGAFPFLFIAVCSVVMVLRLRVGAAPRNAPDGTVQAGGTALRVALAAVASFVPGVYGCIYESFSLHSLFALLFYLAAGSVFAFLFDGLHRGIALRRLHKKAAYAALLFAIVYSCTSVSFFGFSPAPAVAAFLCLICAENEDFLTSGALGLILGVACGRSYALVIGAIGLICSAFYKYSRRLAPWLGVLSGFAVAFYTQGASSFFYVLPDLVAGLLLFLPAEAFLGKRKERRRAAAKDRGAPQTQEDLPQRLLTLADKFSLFSKKMRAPGGDRLTLLCEDTLNAECARCQNACFDSAEAKERLAKTLFEAGAAAPDRPPFSDLPFCRKKQLLCDEINNAYAGYLRRLAESDRAQSYAACCKCFSLLLSDRAESARGEEAENEEERAAFKAAAGYFSFAYKDLSVTGARRLNYRITGVDEEEVCAHLPQIKSLVEEKCGKRLSLPVLRANGATSALTFHTLPAVRAEAGSAVTPRAGEKDSGDTVCTFLSDNCFYALLCDGMGSGGEAAAVSRMCCRMIGDFTKMGASPKTALSAFNDFLIAQNCERTCTVDLLRLDLYSGRCDFIKCGACPSLVLRQNNTFKISSASMPAGGAREARFEQITVKLRAGDRVIMVSDGVSEELESAAWLTDLLAGRMRGDPAGLAEDILRASASDRDDRSAIVVDLVKE